MVKLGVKHCFGAGGEKLYQIETNSEYQLLNTTSETVGDKLHRQEGNSPDHQLRSQNGR